LSYDFGSELIFRNATGSFENRNVATQVNVKELDVLKAVAHVSTLEGKAPMTIPTVDPASLTLLDKKATEVAGAVMAGHRVGGANPVYPPAARSSRISGTVMFAAVIGTDGHIHSLRITSTPDLDLAIASLAAVRTWTYTPYLLNGEPVEVDTKISVNFNIR
jgi:TonB family protein